MNTAYEEANAILERFEKRCGKLLKPDKVSLRLAIAQALRQTPIADRKLDAPPPPEEPSK